MTPKQKRFCLEYANSGNATESAIKAGYSQKTAYSIGQENLKKPELQKFLQELADQMASAKIATAKEMQEVLTSIIRQELDEEVIVVEGCGDGISEAVTKTKKPSTRDAIKAIETLAKMQGIFDTKTNVNLVIPVFGGEDDLEE
jgi:phage terminase small subunit|nr:MAG TPA: Terminase small subunit [Caudoviricetes sp.]